MRVLIDLLYIVDYNPSGIKKYGFKLATDILKHTEGNEVGILCTDVMLEHIESEIGKSFNYIVVSNKEKRILGRDYLVYRKTNAEKALLIESYDFVISPCANYPVALFSPYIKHVGVIHDLQILKFISLSNYILVSNNEFKNSIKQLTCFLLEYNSSITFCLLTNSS